MKINIEKLSEIFTPSTTNTISDVERSLIENTVHKMVNRGKLNKVEKSLLKDYGLIVKKSK